MAAERKMTAKSLSFAPGKPALTPMSSDLEPPAPVDTPPAEIVLAETSDPSHPETPLKGVVVYLAPAEAIALKVYAAQHSTSIQQLGTEAFADLFHKLGINGGVLTRVRANRKNGGNR